MAHFEVPSAVCADYAEIIRARIPEVVPPPNAVKTAAHDAKIHKPVSVHTLRHCFGTHMLLNDFDIRQIQEYLGHSNVETTMVYTHVVKELRTPARSPLDVLQSGGR